LLFVNKENNIYLYLYASILYYNTKTYYLIFRATYK